MNVAELVDHPFRWVEIKDFITKPAVHESPKSVWNIDDKLQLQILGDATSELAEGGVNGAVRRDFSAKKDEVLLGTVCIYQPIVAGQPAVNKVERDGDLLRVGAWEVRRGENGELTLGSGK
jgi:hypothetical protein